MIGIRPTKYTNTRSGVARRYCLLVVTKSAARAKELDTGGGGAQNSNFLDHLIHSKCYLYIDIYTMSGTAPTAKSGSAPDAPRLQCSECAVEKPPDQFSKAQRMKKGARKCSACVSQAESTTIPPWFFRTPGWGKPKHKDAEGEELYREFSDWVGDKLVTINEERRGAGEEPITQETAVAMCVQKTMIDRLTEIQEEIQDADAAAAAAYAAGVRSDSGGGGAAGGAAAGGTSVPSPLPTTAEHLAKRLAYFKGADFISGFSGATRLLGKGIVSRQGKPHPLDSSYSTYIQAVFNTSVKNIRNYFEGSGVGDAAIQCRGALGKEAIQKWRNARTPPTLATDPEMICYLCGEPMFNIANTGRKWCNLTPPFYPNGKKRLGKDHFPVMECEHILPMITAVAHWSLWNKDADEGDKEYMKEEYAYAHNCCNQIKKDIDLISFNNSCLRDGKTYEPNEKGIDRILSNIEKSSSYDCPNAKNNGARRCPDPTTGRAWPNPISFNYNNSAFQIHNGGKGGSWKGKRKKSIIKRLKKLLKTINANVNGSTNLETYLLFVRCKIIFAISPSGANNIDDLLLGLRPPSKPKLTKEEIRERDRLQEEKEKAVLRAAEIALRAKQTADRQARISIRQRQSAQQHIRRIKGAAAGKKGGGKGKATDYDSSDFDDDESDPAHEWTVDPKLDDVPADFLLGWIINQRTEPEFKKRLYESFSDLLEGAGEAVPQSEHAGERVRAAEGAGEAVPQSEHATSDIMETPIPLSSSKRTQAALPENIEDTAKSGDTTAKVGDQFNPITAETLPLHATKGGSRRLVLGNAKLNRTISKASRAAQKRVGRGGLLRGRIFSKVKGKKTKKRKGKKILTRKKNIRKKRKTIREKKNKRRTNKHK